VFVVLIVVARGACGVVALAHAPLEACGDCSLAHALASCLCARAVSTARPAPRVRNIVNITGSYRVKRAVNSTAHGPGLAKGEARSTRIFMM
jgi:hypothetical protein